MIRNLQRKFVRIALLSVTLVMLLLTVTVNLTYRISIDSDLTEMLELIYKNQGKVPVKREEPGSSASSENDETSPVTPPEKKSRGSQFNQETPYSTRYFVLRISGDTLEVSDLKHIAAVTEEETDRYVRIAVKHGEGFGYYGDYKFYVVKEGPDRYMAVFLDCYQELRSAGKLLVWSLTADLLCIALVYVSVRLLSRKAIEPVIRSNEQQKRFITDAGHELKTPLAVIGTSLSVLEMEVGKKKWIDKAQMQIKKMSGLISFMVTLSGLDEGLPENAIEEFNLSDAVAEVVESFRDTASEDGHDIATDISEKITMRGDRDAICRLVGILMENALKYSSPGGTISIQCVREQRKIFLRQTNPCGEISTEDLKKLFDRFYRPDPSRSSSTGGFGLGLSIAKSIAEMHNGTIDAKYHDGNIVFTIMLRA